MKLGIGDFLRKLVGLDEDAEPAAHDDEAAEEKLPPIALCSPYRYPSQWQAELNKPCYCGLPAIWLDFYHDTGEITAVGTCQHHRGVARWAHIDDGPVQAYWDSCPICPPKGEAEWPPCLGHIVVGDQLHTVIPMKGHGYGFF